MKINDVEERRGTNDEVHDDVTHVFGVHLLVLSLGHYHKLAQKILPLALIFVGQVDVLRRGRRKGRRAERDIQTSKGYNKEERELITKM